MPDEAFTELQTIFSKLTELKDQVQIFPEQSNIFRAFKSTPFDQVKVVVLGQDPFHNEVNDVPVANGFCFAVNEKIEDKFFLPPSLRNILSEIQNDVFPMDFNLERLALTYAEEWGQRLADQGVLLLNTALTVEKGHPESHCKLWENFISIVMQTLAKKNEPVIWMLWGKHAHSYESFIPSNHKVIKTSHPSPLGATKQGKDYPAFIGSRCFSLCNILLEESDQTPIQW